MAGVLYLVYSDVSMYRCEGSTDASDTTAYGDTGVSEECSENKASTDQCYICISGRVGSL